MSTAPEGPSIGFRNLPKASKTGIRNPEVRITMRAGLGPLLRFFSSSSHPHPPGGGVETPLLAFGSLYRALAGLSFFGNPDFIFRFVFGLFRFVFGLIFGRGSLIWVNLPALGEAGGYARRLARYRGYGWARAYALPRLESRGYMSVAPDGALDWLAAQTAHPPGGALNRLEFLGTSFPDLTPKTPRTPRPD